MFPRHMQIRFRWIPVLAIAALLSGSSGASLAEEAAALAAETPESRQEQLDRWGVQQDPGPDPDPKQEWIRFGRKYTIEKFQKKRAAWDQPEGWVRPISNINIPAEIYRQEGEFVWVWLPVHEPPAPREELGLPKEVLSGDAPHPDYVTFDEEGLKWLRHVRPEFEVVTPPSSGKTVVFRESSAGLPARGSWRNGLDVADMNGDGFPDIIAPPQRGAGSGAPTIFLGDGKGGWKLWDTVRWPISASYGTVVAGDLNGDGHQDLVLAAHLYGLIAYLGDGEGNFRDASDGLPNNFPTRRAILTDIDNDGDLDIVVISEGASPREDDISGSLLRAYLNDGRAGRWTRFDLSIPDQQVAGDWLAAGNFNGDRYPDIAGSSIMFSGTDLIYLSEGKLKYREVGRGWLPFYSYYFAMTAGRFGSKKLDDLIVTYGRTWPSLLDPKVLASPPITRILGIDRISFEGKKPSRTPIVRWESRRTIQGLAGGDFDGDGHRDLIYWRPDPHQFVVLLGDGKGNFRSAEVQGLQSPAQTLYDIKVADVNLDGRPDVIVMYEATGTERNGAIRVFLGEGAQQK
ncbi:MAG TPA: VCBS repeat-containing protein [Thermoanaerobaculia bacterium]|nr:VCBS repeat-containing protein [Thermoanaerobaculia bacterium]